MRQNLVENIDAASAEFSRRGHISVARGFHGGNVFMREGVFAVVLRNARLEIFGVFRGYRDEFLLTFGSISGHWMSLLGVFSITQLNL